MPEKINVTLSLLQKVAEKNGGYMARFRWLDAGVLCSVHLSGGAEETGLAETIEAITGSLADHRDTVLKSRALRRALLASLKKAKLIPEDWQ